MATTSLGSKSKIFWNAGVGSLNLGQVGHGLAKGVGNILGCKERGRGHSTLLEEVYRKGNCEVGGMKGGGVIAPSLVSHDRRDTPSLCRTPPTSLSNNVPNRADQTLGGEGGEAGHRDVGEPAFLVMHWGGDVQSRRKEEEETEERVAWGVLMEKGARMIYRRGEEKGNIPTLTAGEEKSRQGKKISFKGKKGGEGFVRMRR